MTAIKKVSIVIPTYNRAKYLDLTLQSIKNQVAEVFDVETIIADDGSSDETVDVVKKYENLFDLKYFFQEDQGNRTGSARNLGISNAEGDIIIFVDCGIILASNCINEHMRVHAASSKPVAGIGYVYGFDQYSPNLADLIHHVDMGDIDGSIDKLNAMGKFQDMRETLYKKINFKINEMPAPWALFITCNCSVARSALDEVGYFDRNLDFNWGVEDLELGYRLWKHGVKFVICNNATSIHYPHDADMNQKFEEEKVNKKYFHEKYKCLATKVFLDCGFLELNEKILTYKNNVSIHL
jgi:glycosyltransferase involved in cell wall biosynthesis